MCVCVLCVCCDCLAAASAWRLKVCYELCIAFFFFAHSWVLNLLFPFPFSVSFFIFFVCFFFSTYKQCIFSGYVCAKSVYVRNCHVYWFNSFGFLRFRAMNSSKFRKLSAKQCQMQISIAPKKLKTVAFSSVRGSRRMSKQRLAIQDTISA